MIYRNAVTFALKRLWNQRWLALSQAVGLLAAVALAAAIPIYANGVNASVLRSSLAEGTGGRQPFDFVFRYIGSWYGSVSADRYRPVDDYLSEQAAPAIGLPALEGTRYLATANLQLYPFSETIAPQDRMDLVRLAFASGVFEHVRLVEGSLPRTPDEAGGPTEVLVSLDLANALDLQAGDRYLLYSPANGTTPAYRQEVIVSGLWVPVDPAHPFWALYPADSFQKKFLAAEESWWSAVAALPTPVDEAAWRLELDGRQVNSDRVPGLLSRIAGVQNRANALLPHTDLESSPAPALRQYRRDTQALTGTLFAFSAPVLGLALYFLWLAAGLFVRSQQAEIAVLRSRGAARAWIVTVYLVEWSALGLAALIFGLPGGLGLASLIGRTRSFLDFSNPPAFVPQLSWQAVGVGLLALLLGIGFCLLPAWQYGKDTVISYKQERARARRKPFWQRAYLDLVCLLPALYGLYTLRAQGRLSLLGRQLGSLDPFGNPLLFLLPVFFLVGASLLALRLLPTLLNGCAVLAARLPGVVGPYVLRQFARSGGSYQGVLLLAALTVGLAAFTASEAATLDENLHDSLYYRVGADLSLVEGGEFIPDQPAGASGAASESGLWNFLPVREHLALPGVEAAARVGDYSASLATSGRTASGRLVGVDFTDFAQVAFFREDFAAEPLNGLLNRLASSPDALLVDQGTWERFHLATGDTLELRIESGSQSALVAFHVAGAFSRFPTWSPDQDGALFIANLETVFEAWGSLQPYRVWLKTAPEANPAEIVAGVNRMGVAVVTVQDTRAQVAAAFRSPGRQGVLGLLSVGFLSASGLTLVGVFLYTLFSLRERFIQLGVLRAIGLSVAQMRFALGAELVFLTLNGILIGTAAGALAVLLFIPHLPVTSGAGLDGGAGVLELPHLSRIAWGDVGQVYLLYGAALLVGIVTLLASLRRMSIYQAVKMGETI